MRLHAGFAAGVDEEAEAIAEEPRTEAEPHIAVRQWPIEVTRRDHPAFPTADTIYDICQNQSESVIPPKRRHGSRFSPGSCRF